MKCPVCKGKRGKNVTKQVPASRYTGSKGYKVKVFEQCKNCNGLGTVSDGANNTPYTLEAIRTFCYLMTLRNNWRQREVAVYQHPLYSDKVISVGIPFDGSGPVINVEDKSAFPQLASASYQEGRRFFTYD